MAYLKMIIVNCNECKKNVKINLKGHPQYCSNCNACLTIK